MCGIIWVLFVVLAWFVIDDAEMRFADLISGSFGFRERNGDAFLLGTWLDADALEMVSSVMDIFFEA